MKDKKLGNCEVYYNNIKLVPSKRYELWISTEYCTAQLIGAVESDNFDSACDRFFLGNDLYCSENLTYDGHRIFPSQKLCIQNIAGSFGV